MIPEGFDPETGFPPGYVAEYNGVQVRRVGTSGDPNRGLASWTNYQGVAPRRSPSYVYQALAVLEQGRTLYGDCYVDMLGRPVRPDLVVVRLDAGILGRADPERRIPDRGESDATRP